MAIQAASRAMFDAAYKELVGLIELYDAKNQKVPSPEAAAHKVIEVVDQALQPVRWIRKTALSMAADLIHAGYVIVFNHNTKSERVYHKCTMLIEEGKESAKSPEYILKNVTVLYPVKSLTYRDLLDENGWLARMQAKGIKECNCSVLEVVTTRRSEVVYQYGMC